MAELTHTVREGSSASRAAVGGAPARDAERLAPSTLHGPGWTAHQVMALQRTAGNQATQTALARKVKKKPTPAADPATVSLRTGLDSKVRVSRSGTDSYAVFVTLDANAEQVQVATYTLLASAADARELPVYIEDFVTAEQALVRIQFDPELASVKLLTVDEKHGPQRLHVECLPTKAADLRTAQAPTARDAGPGYVAEGKENITQHASGSDEDRMMSAIASAEGGFASTEGSDLGIFTWGQGQWTVGAGLLQPVMQFIKDARPDLYERYWGQAGLDVVASVFQYEGKAYDGKKQLRKLFRSNKVQNRKWVELFARAGVDPQIQRLQREYQRGEVRTKLKESIAGKTPEDWLNLRGKAFYYSMWVNLPSFATKNFEAASKKAGKATAATEAIKGSISTELEALFKNSGVWARSGDKHHYIAFWGEGGRKLAVDEADKHIADPTLDTKWTTAQWTKHKADMVKRQSRYQKTAADIDKALAQQDVEPDVPKELGGELE